MPLNTATGAFTFTNATQATGAAAGQVIQSAAWNQIHTDDLNALTAIYQQALADDSVSKNLVFGNGGFEVWQRGAGSSASININSTPTTGTYGPDRWYLSTQVSVTCSLSAVAGIDTPNNSVLACQITRNAGTQGALTVLGYPLDTETVLQLRGNKVALQFWAKTGAGWSPTNGTLTISVLAGTGTPVKQVVGYTNQTTVFQATVNIAAATAATLYTMSSLTITTNTAAPANITQAEVQFSWTYTGAAAATDQITLDNVEVETADSLAAPYNGTTYVCSTYDHLPFTVMLRDCMQHYQKTFPYNTAPAQSVTGGYGALTAVGAVANVRVGQMWIFREAMRNTPTITTYAPSVASSNWIDITAVTSMVATVTVSSSTGCFIYSSASVATAGDICAIHAAADAGI